MLVNAALRFIQRFGKYISVEILLAISERLDGNQEKNEFLRGRI